MARKSIRARLTAAFLLTMAPWVIVACAGLIWNARRTAEREVRLALDSASTQIRGEAGDIGDTEEGRELLEVVAGRDLAVMVVRADGSVLWRSQSRLPRWPLAGDDGWRVTTVRAGSNTVVIGRWWAPTASMLRRQAAELVFLSLFVLVAATFGAWVLVGRTLTPIGELAHQAQSASADALRIRLSAPSDDAEIVDLVATLNGLLDRLAAAAASRGRFYEAASHELRTPLQALCGHLELACFRPRDAGEYQVFVQEAYVQARRLSSLVQALLLLNRLECHGRSPNCAVDLTDVCESVAMAIEPVVRQRGLRLEVAVAPGIEIAAVPEHAEVLVRNLADNAAQYAREGGRIRMELRAAPGGPVLVVHDECELPAGWSADRFLEPFYRSDRGRSARPDGNGLGLAICRAIVDVNGWRIGLAEADGGLRCTVVFASPPDRQDPLTDPTDPSPATGQRRG